MKKSRFGDGRLEEVANHSSIHVGLEAISKETTALLVW
jgi:hypothetical protein